jgi:ABC-type cobalamin/Fe3+-siderophores transport system ATPase subunit
VGAILHAVSRREILVKIDIHAHTRKCKSGDAPTREITPAVFCEKVQSTEVGIIAITNHNVFDLSQFKEIVNLIGSDVQVWPGVELDVQEGTGRGHLIVIVSPKAAEKFYEVVHQLTKDSTPDSFKTTIELVLKTFEDLEPLYVTHYKQKMPCISDEALEKLTYGTSNPGRVIKEVTNSISAGIYISHGHASIYGSDVHDWSTYEEQARDLPDLRLPIESFDHFCLLLEKNPTTINTILDKKIAEDLTLMPFGDPTVLKLKVFNDINVIFGPKGTGKSCILKAIAKHYCDAGIDAKVYESASDKLDEIFDIRGKDLSLNLNTLGINYCKDEIEALRGAAEVGVTSLSKYETYFRIKSTSKNAKKIRLKDIDPEEEGASKREFLEFNEGVKKIFEFLTFIEKHPSVKKELSSAEIEELTETLSKLLLRMMDREWKGYSGWKQISLLNSAIDKFRVEVERKTGTPAKPSSTGFREYALNRVKIGANAAAIIKSLDTPIKVQKETVGNLGTNKGELQLWTEFKFQDGTTIDGGLTKLKAVNKGPQKKFAQTLRDVLKHAYADDLFQHIAKLNAIEDVEKIETVYEMLLFKRHFALNGSPYSPSSGEASMVMLQKELETEKDVYILDEPERSLGNEYINDVIVPLIKQRARAGKKLFISTHDANIAVRTLPYCSVYRRHGPVGYTTYLGNPFSNNLISSVDKNDSLDWKKISMRTLEGGEEAFGERGKIYGNN